MPCFVHRPNPIPRAVAALAAALLVACGGGGGDSGPPPAASCTVEDQKGWLAAYLDEWYFWYRLAPRPNPATFDNVEAYFRASLYTGSDAAFPADRWSGSESTEAFNRFFGDGATLGYGMSVSGLEVAGLGDQPLLVRYVEPRSDAAAQGVQRGDRVLSLNGRPAAELVAANDFALLTPAQAGDTLQVMLRTPAGVERSVRLTASVFALTPVPIAQVVQTPGGRRVGYLMVNQMISQAESGLIAAFAQFSNQGVQDLVLDLRYNGGGLVSLAALLGSYLAGPQAAGQTFANLLYNDKRAATNNQAFRFSSPTFALGLPRVYVLTGRRTCSASEQVINGLRPFAQVISVGDTTCGKPVGFLPTSQCGTTYSVVNFESVNARNEGRYWDGFEASCPRGEGANLPLGTPGEPLLATALAHADSGSCPQASRASASARRAPAAAPRRLEPGERHDMIPR